MSHIVIGTDGLSDREVAGLQALAEAMKTARVAQPESDVEDLAEAALYCCALGARALRRGSWSGAIVTAAWHIAFAVLAHKAAQS